jgi:uncharacterized protein
VPERAATMTHMSSSKSEQRALITGATAGLGLEFAHQLAERGYALVLVARNEKRLADVAAALERKYRVSVETLAADLSLRDHVVAVERRLSASENPVTYLVNNAGLGLRGAFHDNDLEDEQYLLDVLVTAPLRLTHAALRAMRRRRSGTILSVSSVAAYAPRGTYGAAKAYILSFSRWANLQYRRDGVTVSAVVPGFVRTEFHERMRVRTDTMHPLLWLSADAVVRSALRGADRGRAVIIPSVRYKIISAVGRMVPPRLAALGSLHPTDAVSSADAAAQPDETLPRSQPRG